MEEMYQMQVSHHHFECSAAGHNINSLFPHLEASPDGFTECDCCGKDLVEIKCPSSCKEGISDDLNWKRGSLLSKIPKNNITLKCKDILPSLSVIWLLDSNGREKNTIYS